MADIELTGSLGLKTGITKPLIEDAGLIKGGFRTVSDLTARNAIPSNFRSEGMEVKVLSENKKYSLDGGIANANWTEVVAGVDETTLNTAVNSAVGTAVSPLQTNLSRLQEESLKKYNLVKNGDFSNWQ